tara:strand:- start:2069 stop:2794 length:726 start_codon:yes stop_codon:yes gene_type:complete
MSDVIHRTDRDSNGRLIHKLSVNTPDYPLAIWVVNPDLSGVSDVAPLYWKVVGDSVLEMDQSEKDAADEEYATPDPGLPGEGIAVEALATAGAGGQVPTSDGSGGLTMEDAAVGGVFGSELHFAEALGEQSTSNDTDFVSALRMPSSGGITLPAGTYKLEVSYNWKSSPNDMWIARIEQGGVIMGREHRDIYSLNGVDRQWFRPSYITLTDGDYNWEVLYKSDDGSVARIYDVKIALWRMS